MFFSSAMRDTVKAENPDITFGQVGKALGEKWKELDAAGKEQYEAKAREDKSRYETEMAAYKASGGGVKDEA